MLTRQLLEQNLSTLSKLSAPMSCSLLPISGADCFYTDGLAASALCKLELTQGSTTYSYYVFSNGHLIPTVGTIPYCIRDFLLELANNETKEASPSVER